ncbi:hypothetical protein [Planctopirus ephydatiae]|uniref:hypothetical protein n=1 Tax=Planctopirus ephydatiae TaxID=2528019 RepID=UPI00119FF54E|nr:hypothetical protein [Planctopirus ephydatiae]
MAIFSQSWRISNPPAAWAEAPLFGELVVHYCEMEVAVGDVIRLENCVMTILDIDGEEITVKLDLDDEPFPVIGSLKLSRPR